MNAERVGDLSLAGVEAGTIYLLRSEINCRFDGEIELLHVMSKPAGGQVRGYMRPRKSGAPWKHRLPDYIGDWPEVDQATANLLGETVNGFAPAVRS